MREPINHLIVAGGIYHDFEATAAAFGKALQPMGLSTTIVMDAESALSELNIHNCQLLTIDALLFTMTQHEKYAPLRKEWAFELSARARENLASYVWHGGSLLGLHTASICFDGWAEWPKILGAGWVWGRSSHPAAGTVRVERMVDNDALVADAPPFEVFDEVYRGLDVSPHAEPILQARAATDSEFHPVMWRHHYGKGRVVYDSLGHAPDSVLEPTHLSILRRAVQWLLEPVAHRREQTHGSTADA